MNGLDKIIGRINDDAVAECDRITGAAEAESERIRAEYGAKAAELEAEIAGRTEREAESLIARAKSSAAMTRRNIISGERSRNVERAYEAALSSLKSLPREEYSAILVSFAVEAIKSRVETAAERREKYGESTDVSSFELVLNERDRKEVGEYILFTLKNNYKKELGSDVLRRLSLSERTADIDGGLIVRAGAVEENCSFALLAESLRTRLDPIVYKTLYPEG